MPWLNLYAILSDMFQIEQVEKERLAKPSEFKRISAQLLVEFHRFVGGITNRQDLISYPDFTLKDGSVNCDWRDRFRLRNLKISQLNPGAVTKDSTGHFVAPDDNSAVGEIYFLQQMAQSYYQDHLSPQAVTEVEQQLRKYLVDIFNGYAGLRFNGTRDIASGNDFRGVNLSYLAGRMLPAWRQDLLRARQESFDPWLFDRWEVENKIIRTPGYADYFFYTIFGELSSSQDADTQPLSSRAELFKQLLIQPPIMVYLTIADTFYAGDMTKTFINFSAVAAMTKQRMPEGWQAFHGNTTEFRTQQQWILQNSTASIEQFMDFFKITSLKKAKLNWSAISNMERYQKIS